MVKGYREGPESTFTSNGKTYSLDSIFRLLEQRPVFLLQVNRLSWVLAHTTIDPQRKAAADTSVPIIVLTDPFAPAEQRAIVVDGAHRLAKAVDEGLERIRVRHITMSEIKKFEIKGTGHG